MFQTLWTLVCSATYPLQRPPSRADRSAAYCTQRWVLVTLVYAPPSRPRRVPACSAFAVGSLSRSSALCLWRSSSSSFQGLVICAGAFLCVAALVQHVDMLGDDVHPGGHAPSVEVVRPCIPPHRCVHCTARWPRNLPGASMIDRLSNYFCPYRRYLLLRASHCPGSARWSLAWYATCLSWGVHRTPQYDGRCPRTNHGSSGACPFAMPAGQVGSGYACTLSGVN